MSKVLDLDSNEVIDICADPDCNAEIFFGQSVWKKGHDLICSTDCLLRVLGAKAVIAGREPVEPEPYGTFETFNAARSEYSNF